MSSRNDRRSGEAAGFLEIMNKRSISEDYSGRPVNLESRMNPGPEIEFHPVQPEEPSKILSKTLAGHGWEGSRY